ncbi:MAG TPA: hypothetical protein PLH79_05660 [bacterium]|nr:hypothetical protein [bacterium]HPO99784.1 hypothetical protein [bacterium]
MGNKMKAIVLIAAAVGIVAVLNLFVFGPIKKDWDEYNQRLSTLKNEYRSIVQQVSGEESSESRSQPIVTRIDEVINAIQTQNQIARSGFERLDKQLKIIERYDPTKNYVNEVLNQIDLMKKLEANSTSTKLSVSRSWGVDGGLREGRFGTGFRASGGRSMAYANLDSKPVINPRQGTLEFFVKPEWDPNDPEVHHKCMLIAIDSRKMSRDEIATRMEQDQAANADAQSGMSAPMTKMSIQAMLPLGAGPFQRDSLLAVYKGEGPTLSFELRDYVKPPSIVTAMISDWKEGQWYHIAVVWEAKRQALYINGQNKGLPIGAGLSIRDARDVEDELLLGGGMGMGGMGMMGMGGMGMMGMGMMGMGMGMMGMGGMGMMGMGGMSSRLGTSAGQTLTSNISLPSVLSGIYLGTDEAGGFTADCTFDDLRIQDRVNVGFDLQNELRATESTTLLDHFEDEVPEPVQLPMLLAEMDQYQRLKSTGTINPAVREGYENRYKLLKHTLGINDKFLSTDSTIRTIRELYCLNYIRQHTNKSFEELFGLFQISPEITKNDSPQLHKILEFQKLCYDLAQIAVEDRLKAINEIIFKGQGYNVTDEELQTAFRNQRQQLFNDLFGPDNLLVRYGYAGGYGMFGGMGMMGPMGMGMMGPMGMGMMGPMGMGMMGPMGMGGMGIGMAAMMGPLYDPDSGRELSKKEVEELLQKIEDMKQKLKVFNKYMKDGLIPPEVIEEFNKQKEQSNEDYYIKRAVTLNLDADYRSVMKYMYDLEYGPRIITINSIKIDNRDNDLVNVVMDVESHSLKNVLEEEETLESPETAAAAATVGLNR